MRLPIILILLTVVLLPADLRGFANDIATQARVATAAVTDALRRDEPAAQVAELKPLRQVLSIN